MESESKTASRKPRPTSAPPPDMHPALLLGNSRYAVLLTRSGAGYSAFSGRALTRWTPDPLRQTQGFFLYVRDLDSGARWSAGFEPFARAGTRYDVYVGKGRVEIVREDEQIETRTEICVVADADVELRRLTLSNRSELTRRLDVTSYMELVLNDLRGDAAHPVFSKLFIQTAWLAEQQSLLAWRRPRAAIDVPIWVAHRLEGGDSDVTFETDRLQFLGRGRSPANPRVLDNDATLSGTTGDVLDPAFSMRRGVVLAPGESATLVAVLAVAASRSGVATSIGRFADTSHVARAFDAARSHEDGAVTLPANGRVDSARARSNLAALALPDSWLLSIADAPPPTVGRPATPTFHTATDALETVWTDEQLRFFNGIGGFSQDGLEYVLRLQPGSTGPQRPPVPWTNVITNASVGFLATESGAGYTWAGNSRRHRLTPWSNDPVTDPAGEALYIRDDDGGVYWSPTPAPAPHAGGYEVRHGLGYTRYRYHACELESDLTVFVPRTDPLRIALLTLHNTSPRDRHVTAFAFARWVLGAKAQETARAIMTRSDPDRGAIYAENRAGGADADVAFAALSSAGTVRMSADRATFLGPFGTLAAPAAVTAERPLDGRVGAGLDPCAAFEAPLTIPAGETVTLAFLLGQAADAATAMALVTRYRDVAEAGRALDDIRAFWQQLVGGVQIATPSAEIDVMVNGWLAYQTLSCRIWGRSAFYQSGGAFGFRDQLQDAASLVYLAPHLARQQIVLHAAHQFVEGDVLHWWHPPESLGIRTRFSDDLLWLPYITAFYVRVTGDDAVLDESVRFLTGRALPPDEDEISLVPEDSGEAGSVYEHCCRALDRSLTRGAHGLPLIGSGDWNDGMNRVGREGRGESVWLGFFLFDILDDIIPICEQRDDGARAARYRAYRRELATALEDAGWDGAWYRRAYYDDGTPIGAATSDECRIDAIAQAWAVISGAAPPDRAARALDALEEYLVSEDDGLIRLLTPPFDRTPHDPGYIKGYLPGVRENGGQYTHGALWAVRALAEAGRTDRAAQLLAMISPVSHGRTADEVAVYKAEPYVIAADVYGEPPHVGRAGWSWYTGSSGWMLRVAVESLLGFELVRGSTIRLRPRIPSTWPGYTIRYRVPDSRTNYEIEVRRDPTNGVLSARMDDDVALEIDGDTVVIPILVDDRAHRVRVTRG